MGFENVINILAERIEIVSGNYIESYGLDELVQLTINACKKTNEEMKNIIFKNLNEYIKKNLSSINSYNKDFINRKMMLDTFKNDLANKNNEDYINNIFHYYISFFLDKNTIGKDNLILIQNSEFNKHKNNFFKYCQQCEDKIISNELVSNFANQFLDIQVEKEKEKGTTIKIINKRRYKDFINTTKNFLIDNFNYFSSKLYLYYIINQISKKLSNDFEKEINIIIKNLMYQNEIENLINDCCEEKFNDYEKRVKDYLSNKKYFDNPSEI